MTNYVAIVPPVNLVHSIYDFYVQQQSWVALQLENGGKYYAAPRPLALPPPAAPTPAVHQLRPTKSKSAAPKRVVRRTRSSTSRRRTANMNHQTRLTYFPRQSPIHSRPHPRRPTHSRRSRRTTPPPSTPPRSPTPTSAPAPSTASMALLAMYGDMVRDRMQSCMRLEEMVRDARSKDLFAVTLF